MNQNHPHPLPSALPMTQEQWDAAELEEKARNSAMELLEALEGVEPYLEEDPDDDGDYNERVRAVHSAIAKVRGKS